MDSRTSARLGSSQTYRSKGTSWKSASTRRQLATPKSVTDSESVRSADVTFVEEDSDEVLILNASCFLFFFRTKTLKDLVRSGLRHDSVWQILV